MAATLAARCAVALLCAAPAALPAAAAEADSAGLLARIEALEARIRDLEAERQAASQSLGSERLSEQEPELITRLKAVEYQAQSLQEQARHLDAFEGMAFGASFTSVAQDFVQRGAADDGAARINYRGDVTASFPGGSAGRASGQIFTHLRFGQGRGLGSGPTLTSTVNTTAFQAEGVPEDASFLTLAQAWYQLSLPLSRGGLVANAREQLLLTVGKLDPFVFFDQNAMADDESVAFLNNAFVHNPLLDSGGAAGVDAYGFTPGVILRYENSRNGARPWGLGAGAFGAGDAAGFGGSLRRPFLIVQADTGWRFHHLPGNYRAYYWQNDSATDFAGERAPRRGYGLSLDQRVSESVALFGRFGQELDGRSRFDRALTLGAEVIGNRWGRGADTLGIALGWLDSSAAYRAAAATLDADGDGLADLPAPVTGAEQLAELYYRYRLNDRVELTPDLQWIRRPGGSAGLDSITVFGLRAQIGF